MSDSSTESRDDPARALRNSALKSASSILVLQRRAQRELLETKQQLETRSDELARSLALLQATFDSSPDGIVAVDLRGRVLCHNRKFGALLPTLDLAEFRDHRSLALRMAQEMRDPADYLARVTHAAANPEVEQFDTVTLKDGRIFERSSCPQTVAGECVGIVITWRDITARKQIESDLVASQERFRALWATAPDAVVLMDEEGNIHYANAALRDILGFDPDAIVGCNIRQLQPVRLRDAHQAALRRYLESGQRTLNWRATESVGLHCNGSEIPIEISFSHLRAGGAHLFAGFLRDISQRKQAEKARHDLEEQLRESQKMEAIGTLAGGIAHDFNNILGAILGNVALAKTDQRVAETTFVSLEEIQKAGVRAKNLIQQILAFSRKQPREFRDQALQPLIVETVGLMRATLPAAVQIKTALAPRTICIRADTTQIEQVLMNLCTNAWQALTQGVGTIAVTLDKTDIDADTAQTLGNIVPGEYARLTVTDDGQGMDEATLARVFEPFYTTKEINKGTGLGLAVAHGIVIAHGGAITAHSRRGEGATFAVLLPTVPTAQPAPPGGSPAQSAGVKGNGQHILYVDDDEPMVFLVNRLLTLLGYRVSAFDNPLDALTALRANPQDFDLVVTDFNMPTTSGLEVAKIVAQLRKDLPVVITSGYINEQLQEGARALGVRHLIHKPNTVDELCTVLQRLIHEKPQQQLI